MLSQNVFHSKHKQEKGVGGQVEKEEKYNDSLGEQVYFVLL